MKLSDEITAIRDKYAPKYLLKKIKKCNCCKHQDAKYCLMCGDCGRQFNENDELVVDVIKTEGGNN